MLAMASFLPAIYATKHSNHDIVLLSWLGFTILMIAQIAVMKRNNGPWKFYSFMLIGDISVVLGIIIGGMKNIGLNPTQGLVFSSVLLLAIFGYMNKKNKNISQISLMVAAIVVVFPGVMHYLKTPPVDVTIWIANGIALSSMLIQLFIETKGRKITKKDVWEIAVTFEWVVLSIVMQIAMMTWQKARFSEPFIFRFKLQKSIYWKLCCNSY